MLQQDLLPAEDAYIHARYVPFILSKIAELKARSHGDRECSLCLVEKRIPSLIYIDKDTENLPPAICTPCMDKHTARYPGNLFPSPFNAHQTKHRNHIQPYVNVFVANFMHPANLQKLVLQRYGVQLTDSQLPIVQSELNRALVAAEEKPLTSRPTTGRSKRPMLSILFLCAHTASAWAITPYAAFLNNIILFGLVPSSAVGPLGGLIGLFTGTIVLLLVKLVAAVYAHCRPASQRPRWRPQPMFSRERANPPPENPHYSQKPVCEQYQPNQYARLNEWQPGLYSLHPPVEGKQDVLPSAPMPHQ